MARIAENVKDGKIVSYRFIVCVGRDAHGKQVRRFATWHPPDGLRQSRIAGGGGAGCGRMGIYGAAAVRRGAGETEQTRPELYTSRGAAG